MAVTHFASMLLIVTFFGNKWLSKKIALLKGSRTKLKPGFGE